jgi:hypothetical protein
MVRGSRLKYVLAALLLFCLFAVRGYAAGINYSQWEQVLNAYVDHDGRVNYKGLKENRSLLDGFLEQNMQDADINALSDNEQKAFWINAYNALTLRLIVDHYPMKFGGIRTINWGRPWSIPMKVAGRPLTLSEIEHEILRKWDPIDPRIHFAINCASIGCPKLPNTHFDPEQLEMQLDKEAKRFINDPQKVRLDRSNNILYYSAIFDWFDEDFVNGDAGVTEYILKYFDGNDKDYILENGGQVRLKTLNYDWGLNEQ